MVSISFTHHTILIELPDSSTSIIFVARAQSSPACTLWTSIQGTRCLHPRLVRPARGAYIHLTMCYVMFAV